MISTKDTENWQAIECARRVLNAAITKAINDGLTVEVTSKGNSQIFVKVGK